MCSSILLRYVFNHTAAHTQSKTPTARISTSMPLRRHRLGLSHLKGKFDTGVVKARIKAVLVSPFVVFRLGSGRVQTKALRVRAFAIRAVSHRSTSTSEMVQLSVL